MHVEGAPYNPDSSSVSMVFSCSHSCHEHVPGPRLRDCCLIFPAEVHGSVLQVAKRSSHLGRSLQGVGLSVHSAKEGHSIHRQGTGSCAHGGRLHFDFPHQCSYFCVISSSWTWTPCVNPCHGQGGRCQVSRGHLSPADHMNGTPVSSWSCC